MADKPKTYKVKLGGAWIYEKAYPNGDTLVIEVPAGHTVEMDESSYEGIMRMNKTTGRPTMELEKLEDGASVQFSQVEALERVEKELRAKGVTVTGRPEKPTVRGKYKGVFAELAEATAAKASVEGAVETESTTKAKGGK